MYFSSYFARGCRYIVLRSCRLPFATWCVCGGLLWNMCCTLFLLRFQFRLLFFLACLTSLFLSLAFNVASLSFVFLQCTRLFLFIFMSLFCLKFYRCWFCFVRVFGLFSLVGCSVWCFFEFFLRSKSFPFWVFALSLMPFSFLFGVWLYPFTFWSCFGVSSFFYFVGAVLYFWIFFFLSPSFYFPLTPLDECFRFGHVFVPGVASLCRSCRMSLAVGGGWGTMCPWECYCFFYLPLWSMVKGT